MKKKILVFTNDYNNVINLRIDLINYLRNYYKVEVLIIDGFKGKFKNIFSLNKKYKSFNIIKDIILLFEIFFFLKIKKPDLVINFTLKPSIYGTITSYLLGIKSITVVTGLGSIYLNNFSKFFYVYLMRFIFKLNSFIVFQNKFDRSILLKKNNKNVIINGSGFDKETFCYKKKKINKNNFKFLMVARPIVDKGIREYLEAAKIIKEKYNKKINFYLMCSTDNSVFGFKKKKILEFKKIVKFLNFSKKKYIKYLNLSDCFVLPSYREGFSKTILEASSIGKIVITTNVPGCRDIVIHKKTGFLSFAKSVKSLCFFMNHVYLLNKNHQKKISLTASQRVNKYFSCDKVNGEYFKIISKLI